MPWRKPNSPFYKIQRKTLPGYGDTGLLSTRTTSLKRAREMEDLLLWLADEEMYDVLDALRPTARGAGGRVTLADVLRAKKEGRTSELRRGLVDPPLGEALRGFLQLITYNNHRLGLRHIYRLTLEPGAGKRAMASPSARLSWLTTPANVNGIMRAMVAEGYAPRTVQNSAWGALSKLLQHHYGKARTAAVLAECSCPTANDARDVWLTPAECHRVVSACEWEMRLALVLMASVGIDVKPLLALRVRDFDATTWGLWVPDTKNTSRKRLIHVHPVGAYVLALLARGGSDSARPAGTPLLTLTRGQMNHRWRLAREAAGLTRATGFRDDVRVKDLRHTFAVHYLQGGGNLAGLMNRMGHTRGTQSLAYAKHEHRGMSDMEAAAAALGLRLPDRLATELEAIAPAPAARMEDAVEMPAWWFDRTAPAICEAGEMRVVKAYSERGTAGFAEDPKGYAKRWRETQRAMPADTSADSAKRLRRKSPAKRPS